MSSNGNPSRERHIVFSSKTELFAVLDAYQLELAKNYGEDPPRLQYHPAIFGQDKESSSRFVGGILLGKLTKHHKPLYVDFVIDGSNLILTSTRRQIPALKEVTLRLLIIYQQLS